MRVISTNTDIQTADEFPTMQAGQYSLLQGTIDHRNGVKTAFELLKPDSWLKLHRIERGGVYWVDVHEIGVDSCVLIDDIKNCPNIHTGAGHVVTGRFVTDSVSELVRLCLSDATQIEVTSSHRFWSRTQSSWISAIDLCVGEELDGINGSVFVESTCTIQRKTSVFNIEVYGEHTYRVGSSGLLVHNVCPLLRAHLSLQEILTRYGGKFAGPVGHAIEPGQLRVAVFDTKTGKLFYDVSNSGSHLGVLTRHGLPVDEGRYVGGFLQATDDGKAAFHAVSGTFPYNHPNLSGKALDFIRGLGLTVFAS